MDVVDSFFAGLYVLMESEYTSFEPSGTAIDSIYYSLDTIDRENEDDWILYIQKS